MLICFRIVCLAICFSAMQNGCGASLSTCKDIIANLQICNGEKTSIKAVDVERLTLEITPTLTFVNLARFDDQEKTVTLFVTLDTLWNDTSISITRNG